MVAKAYHAETCGRLFLLPEGVVKIELTNTQKIAEILNNDTKLYFYKCLKIRDKNGNIIAFVPNEHQEHFINIVEDWKKQYPDENTRPTLFIIILKARQIGKECNCF